jgi:hypothetical protein
MNPELLFRMNQPKELVRKIVFSLPAYLFESDSTIFLDPAMGGGDYLYEIGRRLLNAGHSKENIASRIYGIEDNIIFVNRAKMRNIGNFMQMKYNEILKWEFDMKFDVIIGNPPYQDKQNNNGKRGGGKSLWDKFVKKSVDLLKEDGYLSFIHPAAWRSINHPLQSILLKNQLIYLVIKNSIEGKKVFGASTRFDYYLMQKKDAYKETKVMFEDSDEFVNIHLNKMNFIPNGEWNLWNEMHLTKTIDAQLSNKMDTRRSFVSNRKDNIFIYPLVHATNKNEIKFKYSSKPCDHQFKKKVIFGDGSMNPIYDNGEYGTTQHAVWIEVSSKKEGEELIKYLESDKVKRMINSLKWGNFQITPKMMKCIPYF